MRGFIKFYNCFMEKGEYKLTPREWYFYSLLYARWNSFLNVAETTISRISELQTVYNDKSKPTRNKANTWDQILGLEQKGLITIAYDGELSVNGKKDYYKTLTISFKDFGQSESINMDVYSRTNDPNELYFLCVLQRFRKKGFSHRMEELRALFNCNSVNTAEKIIRSMKDKKLIKYKQGESYQSKNGLFSRKANTYFIRDLNEVDDVITQSVEDESEVFIVDETEQEKSLYLTIYGELTLREIQRKIEQSHWGTKEFLKEDDIDIMLMCEDIGVESSFTKRCRNSINSMTKKGNDMSSINKWIEGYKQVKEKKIATLEKRKLEESIVNAVVINGETIILDKNNVDKIDFTLADEIYYFDGDEMPIKGNYQNLAGIEGVTEKMRIMALDEYKKHIRLGNKLTINLIMEIREKAKSV